MSKKEEIIVIKRKKVAAHGHHGGAWKVAYADFVTAMMAFFLVMWLMGSDEETKAAISHYFQHPNTPYKSGRDPASQTVTPLGEREGSGDTVLSGEQGMFPDDLVQQPQRTPSESLSEYRDLKAKIQSELDALAYGMDLDVESLHFSIGEDELFAGNGTELKPDAAVVLDKVGKVLSRFPGYVKIAGHIEGGDRAELNMSPFEFTLSRAVSVMKFMTGHHYMSEDRILPVGMGQRRALSSNQTPEGRKRNRRIEFTLSRLKEL